MTVAYGLWVVLLIICAVLLHALISIVLPDLQWWARYLIVGAALYGGAHFISCMETRRKREANDN